MVEPHAGLGVGALGVAGLLGVAAMYTDWRWREVPNWLVMGLILLWALASWRDSEVLNASLGGALACGAGMLAVGYSFRALGWLGGGDGKLLAAFALWLGPDDLGLWLLAMAAIGLLLAVVAWASPDNDFRRRGIPFSCAIAPPALAVFLARASALTGA